MIIDKVSGDIWNKAQEFEFKLWAQNLQANDPKENWHIFDVYFEPYFRGLFASDWSGKTVMEIGLGVAGAMWKMNASRKIGVEPLADKLRAINNNIYGGYEVISRGAESIPEVMDSSVDCVMSFNALDHCHDVPAIMAEIHRVLKSGGILAIGCDLKARTMALDVGHPIALSEDWFREWLDGLGYIVERINVLRSRSYNPESGKDNLDGCLFFIARKK